MTIKELGDLLATIKISETSYINVVYDHFTNPNQEPPFIVYFIESVDTIKANDYVYQQENNYIVDLCMSVKDLTLEDKIEKLFNDNYIPYDKEVNFIDSERMWQVRYFV